MWVEITERLANGTYTGTLANDPSVIGAARLIVEFHGARAGPGATAADAILWTASH